MKWKLMKVLAWLIVGWVTLGLLFLVFVAPSFLVGWDWTLFTVGAVVLFAGLLGLDAALKWAMAVLSGE